MAEHRALLVASGEVPSSPDIASLAAQHDVIVGIDGGAGAILDADILPDVVVGDFDSLTADRIAQLSERGVELEVHPKDKDRTDLELALAWCRDRGVEEVTVTGVWGDRPDHSLAAVGALARFADLRPTVVYGGMTAWVLDAAFRASVGGFEAGTGLSVVALGSHARISAVGVRWPLDGEAIQGLSGLGVSNVSVGRDSLITLHEGCALVFAADAQERKRPPW